ncbi:MAG: response regulator [Burkholderiaceae bacterium]
MAKTDRRERIGPDLKTQGLLLRLQRAMAHEMRTPLHSMSGWLHVLESRLPVGEPMAARALAGIRRAIDQQVELADILTATAVSLGGESSPSVGQQVDRLAVWREALDASAHWGGSSGRELSTVAPHVPMVEGDAAALGRAFTCLLDSLAGMLVPPISVTARFVDAGDSMVLFIDADHELGDPLALDAGSRELPPKEFIGRFRARQLLAEHGIGLLPDATAGGLPHHAGAGSTTARGDIADAIDRGSIAERAPGECRHVLVVDDQPELREVLSALIEQRGDRATTAESAADAIARIEAADEFDIAILDIAMPGEDGISLIGRIRALEQERHLPAIALTAHASAALRRQALSAGFDVFLAKPVDPVLLFETIDRLADG